MKLKEAIKQHYEMSKKLSGEYDEIYGEIVLYLRGSRLSDIDAEEAIGDILNMLLEAQSRSENVEEALGSNMKDFCDNVISSYGLSNKKVKLRENLQLALILAIVGIFWSYMNVELPKITKGNQSWLTFNFSLAMLLNIIIMSIFATTIVKIAMKTRFEKDEDEKKKNQRKDGVYTLIIFIIATTLLVVTTIYFRNIILFTTKIYWVILFLIAAFIITRFMEPKSE